MPVTEESIVIDRPLQEVWDFASDPDNQTVWQSNLVRYELIDAERPAVGVRTRGANRVAGKSIEWTAEYTEWDPPNRAAYRTIEAPFDLEGALIAEDVGNDATRVTWYLEAETIEGFFGKLTDPIVTRMYARDVRASLENLKEVLESEPAT
jgi:uncharacterized membrane protein